MIYLGQAPGRGRRGNGLQSRRNRQPSGSLVWAGGVEPTHLQQNTHWLRQRWEGSTGRFARQTRVTKTLSCPVMALTLAPVRRGWC